MGLTALTATLALSLGPAQAEGPAEFRLRESFGGQVADGAIFYASRAGRRGTIRRLDLDSGADTVLYTAPGRLTHISDLDAGGGSVAFETVSDAVRLFAMRTDGTAIQELVRAGDSERRDCGSIVRLLDVSPSGEVLYDHAVVPCRTRRGRYRVRAHGVDSGTRTLVTRPTDTVYPDMGPPFRELAGDQLLTWGDRMVRVVDVGSGRVRRFTAPDRRTSFFEPDVAADGRLVLDQYRHMGKDRFPRQTIRLIGAAGTQRVIHRTRRRFGQARFCGERPVLHTFTQRGARLRLTVLDPPMEVFEGVREPDVQTSCDARHFVQVTVSGDVRERAYVHTLPE